MAVPRAILFDLDDTLVFDEANTELAWMRVCERFWSETPARGPKSLHEAIQAVADWF